MSSRDVIPIENQRYLINGVSNSRQINRKTQGQELNSDDNIPQPINVVQGVGHLPVSSNSNVPNTMQSSSSVYNGFYSSSTFNSINNFEASLQWLTENRIPNNTLLSDKNLNCNSHTTPSHSCCMNRIGTVDNIGICSPLSSGDSFRSSRDAVAYQTKPPALSVNIMDSVQNWFNLPPLPNQQYGSKFNDQNLNCPQMNFPIDQPTDLKQSDICLQIPDSYFEQSLGSSNSNNSKQINSNINDLNANKIPDVSDITSNVKGHAGGCYQTNIMPREWKQPIQTANYVSSPTLFGSFNDSPDHYLYSIPPPATTSSYCMVTENIGNMSGKLQQTCGMQPNLEKHNSVNDLRPLQNVEQINSSKIRNQSGMLHQYSTDHRSNKSIYEKSLHMNQINENLKMNQELNVGSSQNCTYNRPTMKNFSNNINEKYTYFPTRFMQENSNHFLGNSNGELEQKLSGLSKTTNVIETNDDITSCSEESNIIVEESDETEVESVISIDEIKKTFASEEPVELRCLVCNVKSSLETPATQFIHMNDSFPLTSASKTPVASKLIQILPIDLQHFLKLHNSFMCRHCLNLIETVEVLEVKLLSVKQTLSDKFSKTVQYFLPATPVLEIEDGKAKIIDKEIITCIKKSVDIDSNFTNDCKLKTINKRKKDHSELIEIELEEVVESNDNVYNKNLKESDDSEDEEDNENYNVLENDKVDMEVTDEISSNGELKKQCNICGKILSSVKNYKRHMQLHTKCFSYYCEYCGKGFTLKYSLEKHIKMHSSDDRYQCERCGKIYSQEHRLNTHLVKHLGVFKMNCSECGKGFMENFSLQLHMRSHTKEQPFICEICGSKFVKESNLKCHLQKCKKEEIRCNLCSEVFLSKTYLKNHEIINHGAKPKTQCNVCGKAFVNVKDLKPHMRSHSQDKPFECKICGKCYKSVGNLNHHSKIHDGSKLLICSLCGEGFRRKKLLRDHMNKHSGERPHKCNECGKGFIWEINLRTHMKIHSGDIKMKTCPVCGKKFQNGLEVHMRTHNGNKPYVCRHCGQSFTVNSGLTRHIHSKHPNVLET